MSHIADDDPAKHNTGPNNPPKKPREAPSFSEEFGNALEYAWGPILVAVVFSFVLAVFDPSHEALLGVVENIRNQGISGIVAGVATLLGFLFLPPTLYQATQYALDTDRHFGAHNPNIETILLTWVGRLPLAAVVIAMMRILLGEDHVTLFAQLLLIPTVIFLSLAVLSGLNIFLPPPSSDPQKKGLLRKIFDATKRVVDRPIRLGLRYRKPATWVSALLLLLVAIFPAASVWLGPIAVTLSFVSVAAFALAGLTRLSSVLSYGQIPLIFAVLGLIAAASGREGARLFLILMAIYCFTVFFYPGKTSRKERVVAVALTVLATLTFAWGEANRRLCPALAGCNLILGSTFDGQRSEIGDALAAWRLARPAEDAGEPVRLIAAEGGGLFAAYFTAMYLAKNTDLYGDEYARSIFAISGVSGGSIGAATYWAIRQSGVCDAPDAAPDCHQQKVREILAQDYLSPVMARMFTWDTVDTIVPLSSLDESLRLERGRQLELSLIRNAAGLTDGENPLLLDLAKSWSPERQVPALLLNTTHVETGDRVVLSPFSSAGQVGRNNLPLALETAGDIPVATAAFISARFPLVTAPARILNDKKPGNIEGGVPYDEGVHQYVDGGYFDNSGIETLHDILNRLPEKAVVNDIRLIALRTLDEETRHAPSSGACADDLTPPKDDPPVTTQGLVGAPVATFFGAWQARQGLSWNRAFSGWRGRLDAVAMYELPLKDLNFTVSWYLGQSSFCGIERNLNAKMICEEEHLRTRSAQTGQMRVAAPYETALTSICSGEGAVAAR
ncbi:hypothetical protein JJJ17_06080 [Paracoccus caeni]|uniref:Patatin-like phospholipase n=1 Tax=Paracoccus caeni TaxID=657651 RepID=A0A934W058_9RHOB|nr:hypothetical protein [Paracoccus caeni]MBK4215489.1 hypothetical protein [Paracoccus caeni]